MSLSWHIFTLNKHFSKFPIANFLTVLIYLTWEENLQTFPQIVKGLRKKKKTSKFTNGQRIQTGKLQKEYKWQLNMTGGSTYSLSG